MALEHRINTSVPVSILELPNSEFNLQKNEFVTHAKLKMFYIGETEDRRLFTKGFSERLLKTLPQSPVVGYYDEDSEDFRAHNHKQYVYGYVPESATVEFEEEDGKIWVYTDVILFTGRNDNIGEVAKKIIGMQHSLELDPDSVQYIINRDDDGNFKSVEFVDGKFVGLSVVGDSEKPAFTGSHFFTIEEEEQMLEAFKEFKKEVNCYFDDSGEKLCIADFRNLDDIDLKPTQTMANNAERGLELREEYGRGGTDVGVARARDLKNRKNLSPDTVLRMYSYFARHEVDKQASGWNSDEEGYPSAGLIAWLLWGGDAGKTWSESKRNQIKRARESETTIIDRNDELSVALDGNGSIELNKKSGGENMDITETVLEKDILEATETEVQDVENMSGREDEETKMSYEGCQYENCANMEWECDGMMHENCEMVDGKWMCDGMEHDSCTKMKWNCEDGQCTKAYIKEEEMSYDEKEDMTENFMRTPYDEVEKEVVEKFREAHGDYAYIVQWSIFDDMVVYYNGKDGKYYRETFVMDQETEELTWGQPVLVKPRYLTEEEIETIFVEGAQEQTNNEEGGQDGQEEVAEEQKGLLLSESQAEQFKKDMAELEGYRKETKLKVAGEFKDLVDPEVYEAIIAKVDELSTEELETKLSVEAMKKIKAERLAKEAQTITPTKFYGVQKTKSNNQNPVVSLIDQWKDKK